MLTEIFYKKNELFEVEFFEDKECTKPFDFECKKHLYVELKDGDVTPLLALDKICPTDRRLGITAWTPYLPQNIKIITDNLRIKTLNDITPNLSKYIPEDNAILFLSEEDCKQYQKCFSNCHIGIYVDFQPLHEKMEDTKEKWIVNRFNNGVDIVKNITIFLPHATQSELKKVNEVLKELKEQYGVEEVNVFVMHCFVRIAENEYDTGIVATEYSPEYFVATKPFVGKDTKGKEIKYEGGLAFPGHIRCYDINKLTTTNSTGILEPQDTDRLKVIDCKEIFKKFID